MVISEYYLRKKQIITFMLIGAGSTVFDLAVFNGILLRLGIGAINVLLANSAAFVVTSIIKYFANNRFTFANVRQISWLRGAKFVLISSGTFLVFNWILLAALALFPATLLLINGIRLAFGFVGGGVNFVLFRSLVFS
jgi:putative flippase GtrA